MAVTRGEIWTLAGGGDYIGRARPVVIVQDDRYDATESITVCPLTTTIADVVTARVAVEPNPVNGLVSQSQAMADKITTVKRERLGTQVGRLGDADLLSLNQQILLFLGLAAPDST